MPTVEIDRVGGLEPMHELSEIGSRRLDDQVEMVGHQAEQVQTHLVSFHALAEDAQEPLTVGVIPKDRSPFVAPSRHMIHGPFILNPLRPRHDTMLRPLQAKGKNKKDDRKIPRGATKA